MESILRPKELWASTEGLESREERLELWGRYHHRASTRALQPYLWAPVSLGTGVRCLTSCFLRSFGVRSCPMRGSGPEQPVTPESGAVGRWATCISSCSPPPLQMGTGPEGLLPRGQSQELSLRPQPCPLAQRREGSSLGDGPWHARPPTAALA